MLMINEKMNFIRCSQYEYLAKVGSISNYSFQLKDERQSGMLEVLVEDMKYPIAEEELIDLLVMKTKNIDAEQVKEILNRLLESEVLYKTSQVVPKQIPIGVITDLEHQAAVAQYFDMEGYDVTYFALGEDGKEYLDTEHVVYLTNEVDAAKQMESFEYIIMVKANFSPTTFYQLNKLCLSISKKFMIAYLDGHEGVIIPLLDPNQVGCYNDFELLRESSFYNLLDYQVMKEQFKTGQERSSKPDALHFNSLILQTMLLFNRYTTYTNINYYAYSLDFERLVHTKSRLLKFPKCPSCQTDKNLVHAFI